MITSLANNSLGDILLVSSAMSSTDTFDLSHCLAINASHYSPLLDISLSVHSLPSVSSADSIPPFPIDNLAHKVHVETFLSLHQPSFPDSSTAFHLSDNNRNAGIGVLLAAPTAPRLRHMVKEPSHIKKWLNGLVPNTAFSIGKPGHAKSSPQKAEGPDEREEEPRGGRSLRAPNDCAKSRRARLNRNALVFEREIMTRTERGTRISIKIAPTSARTGELEHNQLLVDAPESMLDLHLDTYSLPTPRLLVSTSDAIFPISFESSSDLLDKAPQTLAARRGNKALPHLSLKHNPLDDEAYPSIPTAFLGNTSDSVLPHRRLHRDNVQLDLQSMISTLQSRRVPPAFLPVDINDGDNYLAPHEGMLQDSDSDEWAHIDAFIAGSGDLSLGSSSAPTTASFIVSSVGVGGPDTSGIGAEDMSVSSLASLISRFPAPAHEGSNKLLQQSGIKSSPPEIRGILRGCKSVRFASLPNRHLASQQQGEKSDLDKYVPLVRPTLVQGQKVTASRVIRRPSTISTGISIGRPRLPNPFRPVLGSPTVHNKPEFSSRPSSTPSGNPRKGRLSEGQIHAVPQRNTITPAFSATQKVSVATSRPRVSPSAPPVANKENNKRLTIPPSLKTIDENSARRNSSDTKKKTQGPLRNILTKFK